MQWERRPSKRRTATSRGKICSAAALTSWRLLTSVDVVSAQDVGHIWLSLVDGAQCDVAISWSIPDGNRSELNRLSQVSYARSSADLAKGSSLNMTGSVSDPWHGRRWVQAVLRGLEQDLAYRIGTPGGFGPVETRLPSCHWTGQSPVPSTEPATASAAGPLRLAVLGDLGFRDGGATDQILARIQNSTPDAVIQLGDLTWDLSQQGSTTASDFWSKLQPLSAMRPFMPLPGVGTSGAFFGSRSAALWCKSIIVWFALCGTARCSQCQGQGSSRSLSATRRHARHFN
ncbi:ACP7 [Symbiodinium sp. CCMP2456]|nr:ACP7 [Symbiodinium sp. CCMP2456]